MVAVPGEIPLTIPVTTPTVATGRLLLLHVPPAGKPVKGQVVPSQSELTPTIGSGSGRTVIESITKQPVPGIRYVMTATPESTPKTTPPEVTVATALLLL